MVRQRSRQPTVGLAVGIVFILAVLAIAALVLWMSETNAFTSTDVM
jgi:hypothetical protein